MRTRRACWLLAICGFGLPFMASLSGKQTVPLESSVHAFLNTYCIQCHGSEKQKGDRAFHELAIRDGQSWKLDLSDHRVTETLEDILDQLNLGEMPPEKKGVAHPTPQEIKATVQWLTRTLESLDAANTTSQTVLRRLNRLEYKNTIEDLLGLENLTVDPTRMFPADENHHGFTKIGEALGLSESHLDQYLTASDQYLRMAFSFGEIPKSRKIQPPFASWGYPNREPRTPWMYKVYNANEYIDIGAGAKNLSRHIRLPTYPQRFVNQGGIPVAGYYKISVNAEALNRLTHPYDPKMIPTDLQPPMQLAIYVAENASGLQPGGVNMRKRFGLWDLKDHEAEDYGLTLWLPKGSVPFVNWDNGPGPSDYWMRDILIKYHDDVEFRGKEGSHAWHIVGKNAVPGRAVSDVWKGPLIRMHHFSITGPLPQTFHSSAQREFLDGQRDASRVDIQKALTKFVRKAFRHPVDSSEVAPFVDIARKAQTQLGRSPAESLILAMKAVLVSPDFLYLREDTDKDGKLTSHAFANRLSYCLWSSMPDAQLLHHAKTGELRKPQVLANQVRRMLKDSKSDAFVKGLCDSWLRFDKLGLMPPDGIKYSEFYRHGLESSIREETERFLTHILQQNRPPGELLSARYSFLNQALARLYGMDGVHGSHFRRVKLSPESQRNGLLGHASILTLSANGVDTSPVVRGIWVLENILGTPPPPPPPDVEPLEPDVRGTTTLKQQLAKHRNVETCAECHNKIDPLGFPLEYFNPIGGYRANYVKNRRWDRMGHRLLERKGQPVDGRAELPSGEQLSSPRTLTKYLLSREEQFLKALTTKMLTYSTGREVTFRDSKEINRIVDDILIAEKGMQDLVVQVLTCESFLRK